MRYAVPLFVFALGFINGCDGRSDESTTKADTSSILLNKTFFSAPSDTAYRDTVDLQYGGKHVLATVDWTAARKQGCLYIQQIRITRTDRETTVKTGLATFQSVECGMQNMGDSDADTTRSESAVLKFQGRGRNGVQSYSWKMVRTLYGDGRLEAPTVVKSPQTH